MTHKIKSIEFDGRTFWVYPVYDKDGNWLKTRWYSSKEAAEIGLTPVGILQSFTSLTEAGLNEQKEG